MSLMTSAALGCCNTLRVWECRLLSPRQAPPRLDTRKDNCESDGGVSACPLALMELQRTTRAIIRSVFSRSSAGRAAFFGLPPTVPSLELGPCPLKHTGYLSNGRVGDRGVLGSFLRASPWRRLFHVFLLARRIKTTYMGP